MKVMCVLLSCLSLIGSLFGQAESSRQETGRRLTRNYPHIETSGRTQNWAIIRDQRGFLYSANGSGVLEYDGSTWRKINLPNLGPAVSLALNEQNRIYVGGTSEMGYLGPDSLGRLSYHSLMSMLPDSLQDLGYLTRIYVHQGDIFFKSSDLLLWIEGDSHQFKKIWRSKQMIFVNQVEDQLFLWTRENGLQQLEGEDFIPFAEPQNLAEYSILPGFSTDVDQEGKELLFMGKTAEGGYSFQSFDGTSFRSLPQTERLAPFMKAVSIADAFYLKDQAYLIQTYEKGAVVLDRSGQVQEVLNTAYGLAEDLNYGGYLDDHQIMWMPRNNGLLRVEPFSPFSFFGEAEQLDGGPLAVIRHQGELYVGTHNGCFRLIPSEEIGQAPYFEEIGDLASVFAFYSDGETLFMCSRGDLSQLKNGTLSSFQLNPPGVFRENYFLYPSAYDSTLLYQGMNAGVQVLKKVEDRWRLAGEINFPGGARSIIETSRDTLLMGTTSSGLKRFVFSDSSHLEIDQLKQEAQIPGELHTFSAEEGIPPGLVYVWNLAGRMVLTTSQGMRKWNPSSDTFVPESYFGEHLADPNTFTYLAAEDGKGRIYILTASNSPTPSKRGGILTLIPNGQGTYTHQTSLLHRLPPSLTFSTQNIYADPDNPDILWIAGKELTRFDASKVVPMPDSFPVYLRMITTNRDSVVYFGQDMPESPMKLPYASNTLRFEFAAPFFQAEEEIRYQIMLEGNDEAWTEWSDEIYADYTNLREGSYRFRVRARNVAYTISESAPFELLILPPWYRTWWAYALYALLGLLFTLFMASLYNRWRMRKILAKNLELEAIVDMRTEEIQDKNQQLSQTLVTLKDTQNQLIMQEKMASLGQMATGVAHEIKNPLNFIQNFSISAMELADGFEEDLETYLKSKDPEDLAFLRETVKGVSENTKKIYKHGERATHIVKGMMNHVTGSAGERVPTQVNTLVEEAIQLAYQGYKVKNDSFHVEIKKHLASELPLIEINPQDIRRVIINLVNNACYAMDQQAQKLGPEYVPSLTVETRKESGQILLSIRDNGTGIPQDIKNQIFQPFFTTKPTGKGNIGLGLSMTYDMITQGYQGTIECDSHIGKFTAFRIMIPLSPNQNLR